LPVLSDEDNELLARVGPGTPMGTLFRRFWIPAALSSELEADGAPLRLRLLGEDMLAFRDSSGRAGIVEPYCSHKLAPLFFGRNEGCGLRCVYHGWKFDADGRCVDMPNVDPANAERMKPNVAIASYPVREAGGVVWTNLGPNAGEAEIPGLEWTQLPAEHVYLSRWLQRSNYAQGLEGELDSAHLSFLHRGLNVGGRMTPALESVQTDGAPVLEVGETDYGMTYGARRTLGTGQYHWRTTHWLLPFYSMLASAARSPGQMFTGRAWVPVDDYHVTTLHYIFRLDRPIDAGERAVIEEGDFFPPLRTRVAYTLPDGYTIDTYLPKANKENDYEIDRTVQKTQNFTGIRGANDQDRCLQENMASAFGLGPGKIAARSREHLVASDRAGIMTRRLLLKLARDLQNGVEPTAPYAPARYRVRPFMTLSPIGDFVALLAAGEQRSALTAS
jgi:phenylpropionate dioxygenase-like ring-hydroxylating dioxygenase large terminal subunit